MADLDAYDAANQALNGVVIEISGGGRIHIPGIVRRLGDGINMGPKKFDTKLIISGSNSSLTVGDSNNPTNFSARFGVIYRDAALNLNDGASVDVAYLKVFGGVGTTSGTGTITFGTNIAEVHEGGLVHAKGGQMNWTQDNLTPENNLVTAERGATVRASGEGSFNRGAVTVPQGDSNFSWMGEAFGSVIFDANGIDDGEVDTTMYGLDHLTAKPFVDDPSLGLDQVLAVHEINALTPGLFGAGTVDLTFFIDTPLAADFTGDDQINIEDYQVWKASNGPTS